MMNAQDDSRVKPAAFFNSGLLIQKFSHPSIQFPLLSSQLSASCSQIVPIHLKLFWL